MALAKFQTKRHLFQALWAAATNSYLTGFLSGKIYQGRSKTLCVPGLNCYSCPGAIGACPIGALQAVLSDRKFMFSCYVFGFLTLVGALLGRFVCGWLCPFGLIQDLLHKIPFPRKIRTFRGDRILRYLKYVLLLVFVILLPLFMVDIIGQGDPAFCKYICPSGTLLGGWPLVLGSKPLRELAGWLFAWKNVVLAAIILLSIMIYRPFCKYLCPLGGIYAGFNRFSLYRLRVDSEACVHCGKCKSACKMGVDPVQTPSHAECIRCGDCRRCCPTGAISLGFRDKGKCSRVELDAVGNESRHP